MNVFDEILMLWLPWAAVGWLIYRSSVLVWTWYEEATYAKREYKRIQRLYERVWRLDPTVTKQEFDDVYDYVRWRG